MFHSQYKEHAYNIFKDKTKKLRYAKIMEFDIQNGSGIGYTLFVQGCNNYCRGCFNPETWDFNGGKEYTQEIYNNMIDLFDHFPQIKRLTLCGGEPLQNLELVNFVAAEFKRLFPERYLWVYTGLLYENIKDNIRYKALLELTDVLIDGRFIQEERDLTLKWRGSKNQRVIDVQKSLKQDKVILYDQ